MSQRAFASMLGITQQAVSQMAVAGVIKLDETGMVWLRAYVSHLREQAAGRLGKNSSGPSLADERAALSRAQRESIEHKNAVTRGEFAPIGLLADVLSAAASAVVDRMDRVESELSKRCPELPETAKRAVMAVLAGARNEWVSAATMAAARKLDEVSEIDEGRPA